MIVINWRRIAFAVLVFYLWYSGPNWVEHLTGRVHHTHGHSKLSVFE